MAEDFWQNDDLEYAGDFVADLDKIVEQHRSKLQVMPAQGSSQVCPAQTSPEVPQDGGQTRSFEQPQITHHLYGSLPDKRSKLPTFRPPLQQSSGGSNSLTNKRHNPHGAGPPRPKISPGIFKDFPSPLPIAASYHREQTSPTDLSGVDLPRQPHLNGSRVQRSGSQGVNLRQLFGREKGEAAKDQDAGHSAGVARPDEDRPDAPIHTMSALVRASLEDSPEEPSHQRSRFPADGQLAEMRHRLGQQEGTISVMRARLETAEREKESLQRQMRGSGASPHPPQTMAELQSQLDRINKQLLFKDQELLEGRRRQLELSKQVEEAEELNQRLEASETEKKQLQRQLDIALVERRATAAEAGPSGSPTFSPRLRALNHSQARTPNKPPKPSLTPKQLQPASQRPALKPVTRSIGVNAVASREQEPDPVPPWESPAFLSSPSTQPSVWQELCAEAGESVTALIAANAAEGFDALLASNTTVRLDGLLSGVQTKLKNLVSGEGGAGDLLYSLSCFLANCVPLVREMQGYVELKQQMPVRPRHLIGGQAKEQLALGSNAHSQHKNALDAVTSALHVLAAVLTVSEEGRSLACASCRPCEDQSAPLLRLSIPQHQPQISARVRVVSQGSVIMDNARPNVITVDEMMLSKLRSLCEDGSSGSLQCMGVLMLLLDLQSAARKESASMLALLEAVLMALHALLKSPGCPVNAKHRLAESGLLDGIADEMQPELTPHLLGILRVLAEDKEGSEYLCIREGRSGEATQMDVDSRDQNPGADSPTDSWDGRHDLADVPLLCLRPSDGEERGDKSSSFQLTERALSFYACLLELRHFTLLQHHLFGQDRSGSDTCLGLRLCLFATSLLNDCDGGMLSSITGKNPDYARQGALQASAEQVEALILMQETLLLVRGLLGESATHSTVLSDLTATSASTRISLALTSRLSEWQPGFSLNSSKILVKGLAAWAVSIGIQYTGRPFYNSRNVGLGPSIVEIIYLAKSIRRRILHRLDQTV